MRQERSWTEFRVNTRIVRSLSRIGKSAAAHLAELVIAQRRRQVDRHNLKRLSARDLHDLGVTQGHFEFHINHRHRQGVRTEY